MTYRKIKSSEIARLESQGCTCHDWTSILVKEDFIPDHIHTSYFEGKIKLGLIDGKEITAGGVQRRSQIRHCSIANCQIGDQVSLVNVGILENYSIDQQVIIEHVNSLVTNGMTAFGNGIEIEILNEGGGRLLPIFADLNAQVAYLLVHYPYNSNIRKSLIYLIKDFCNNRKSNQGKISENACIRNTQTIQNVFVGPGTEISGTSLLQEGTIASTLKSPVKVGHQVIGDHFIIQSGTRVESGAIIDHCFLGQGVRIGKQYSAEQSAFFANCEAFHGEAVSLFAGPYSVTHHKSTLLISCMVSFYNAGSGTNQSNHMYKLGPLHQGIIERGSKTGSFSYLMWPCKIGPYSVVMGKHNANFDTSEFPFSYITLEQGKSVLTPAMNLFTVGTKRDTQKWPQRDRRVEEDRKDFINFELFNPFVVQKMLNACDRLSTLYQNADRDQKHVSYRGITIPRLLLKMTTKYYQIGLKNYFGDQIIKRLETYPIHQFDQVRKALQYGEDQTFSSWVDLAGLITPAEGLKELEVQLSSGKLSSLDQLEVHLRNLYQNYEHWAWSWCASQIEKMQGIEMKSITYPEVKTLIQEWSVSAKKLRNMILQDAKKEFDSNSKISYGSDGDEEIVNRDFEFVRGTYPENNFVKNVREEIEDIDKKTAFWLEKLKQIAPPETSYKK